LTSTIVERTNENATSPLPSTGSGPLLAFISPVWKRHELASICFAQRRRMIDALAERGIPAVAILIGDEPEHEATALAHGFEWVPMSNASVGRKWNAGYQHAKRLGCSHAMAIGSDSWLDPEMVARLDFFPDKATAITGLSAFKEDGTERFDLFIRYPAGFGVAMFYPVPMLPEEPCEPTKNKGCDSSTWQRVGRSRMQVEFSRPTKCSYVNFASPDVQITPYKNLQVHRRQSLRETRPEHVFGDLRARYDTDLVDAIEGLYAARNVGAFMQLKTPAEAKAIAIAERHKRVEERTGRRVDRYRGPSAPRKRQGAR
jgi:hypothetical protein